MRLLDHVEYAVQGRVISMQTELFSFGYKHGLPKADIIWDVRFLPNPYYVPELKEKTGLVPEVSGYVLTNDIANDFFAQFNPLFLTNIKQHKETGRETFRIAIGCTGGKHRSVAVVEYLHTLLQDKSVEVDVYHRDIDKE